MVRTHDVQFLGSALVIAAFAASEAAARLLDASPGSPLAWYLNVELFSAFEAARAGPSPIGHLFGPLALEAAVAAFALLAVWRARRYRFGLAFAANLAFLATLCLLGAGMRPSTSARAASLTGIASPDLADRPMVTILLLASLAAFLASHLSFVRAVSREVSQRLAAAGR